MERLPEALGGNVGLGDGGGIGGLAICVREASPAAGAGALQGADLTRRGAANAVAGACVRAPADWQKPEHTYAALDLGTNNCRLLIARAAHMGSGQVGFRVINSFARIVRLGEGLSRTGELSAAAIERTLGALEICRGKMRARGVTRSRLIATEACRSASNGAEFLAKVRAATGSNSRSWIVKPKRGWPPPALPRLPIPPPKASFYSISGAGLRSLSGLPARRPHPGNQPVWRSASASAFGFP